MCLHKKVVAGVVVAAVAVWLLAPNLIGAALPLLVLAVCPLSMIVMMKAMSGNNAEPPSGSDTDVDAELARLRAEVADLRDAGEAEAPTSAAAADRA